MSVSLPSDLVQALFSHGRDGIVVAQNNVISFTNEAAVRGLGLERESQIIGRDWTRWIHLDDRPLIRTLQRARRHGERVSPTVVLRLRRSCGKVRTIGSAAAVVTFGNAPETIVIFRDVTDRVTCEYTGRRPLERFTETLAETLAKIGAAPDLEAALAALGRGAIALLGGETGCVRLFPTPTTAPITAPATAMEATEAYGAGDALGAGDWSGIGQTEHIAYEIRNSGSFIPAPHQVPLPDSVPYALHRGGPAQLIHDLLADVPANSTLAQRRIARAMRSSVAVPILAGNRCVGSLHVDHSAAGHFKPEDVVIAQALASQAAGTIMRVRLEAERHASAAQRARLDGALLVARTAAHELNNALAPVVGYADLLALQPEVMRNVTVAAYVSLIQEAAANTTTRVQRLQRIVRLEEVDSPLGPGKPILDLERSVRAAPSS